MDDNAKQNEVNKLQKSIYDAVEAYCESIKMNPNTIYLRISKTEGKYIIDDISINVNVEINSE